MDCVLFSARSGLANRLRALVGCRVLADHLSVPLYVDWEENGACDAPFDALFSRQGWEEIHFVDRTGLNGLRRNTAHVLIDECVWFNEIWAAHARDLIPEPVFYRSAIQWMQGVKPVPYLQECIDDYLADHDLGASTGIHIRNTDNLYAYQEWAERQPDFSMSKISRIEGFQALIASLSDAGEPIFLATDDLKIQRDILSRFGNVSTYGKDFDDSGYRRHVKNRYERRTRLRRIADRLRARFGSGVGQSWRTTDIGDALIDLMLLARCREIVGTYYSSFSEVSSIIGGTPLSVLEDSKRVPGRTIRRLQEIAAGAIP